MAEQSESKTKYNYCKTVSKRDSQKSVVVNCIRRESLLYREEQRQIDKKLLETKEGEDSRGKPAVAKPVEEKAKVEVKSDEEKINHKSEEPAKKNNAKKITTFWNKSC